MPSQDVPTVRPDEAAGQTEIVPGLTLWNRVAILLPNYAGLDVEAVAVLRDGRVTVDELRVTRREGGGPVTGEALRRIKVATLVRHSLRGNVPDEQPRRAFGLLTTDDARRLRDDGPTDETLATVGKVYTVAQAVGDPPAKAVADTFEVSARTAGVWVARARSAGLLEEGSTHV